ncbi:MAG: phage tail tape measure protein [Oceanospirillaceae bacterium]|nr:phage tail tape measure protein [Oceanospirillaceae bacterium]
MSDLNLKFIAKFVDQLTGPSRRAMGRFYDDVGNNRKKLDRSLQTAGNLSLVGAESMRMGKTIGRALLEPINVAADFEEAMDTVKAITGANTQEINELTKTARMLGESTSFSASQAADGMKYLGMAGFETSEIIKSMPGVLNLAKAGAVDLGRASDISSDILSGFGLEAAQMGRVGDVLAKTFTSSNSTLEMLGETMKYVGPLAKTAGIDIETMAAMTGLLGNAGIKGSQAGTTLRAMLSRLTAPSKEAANTLAMLGVEIENSEGNMRPLLDIIGDLETGMDGMGNVEQLATLKEIFGEEPASGIAELMSLGKEAIMAYEQELRKAGGTSQRISDEMGDNAKGGVKEWRSAMESLGITIGDGLLPQLTPLIKEATAITRRMVTWAAANPETVKTILTLTAGLAGLLLAIGPIASVLSGLVSTLALVKFATSMLTTIGLFPLKLAFSALIPIIKLVAGLMLANPIGLAVTAIAATAALLMTDWGEVGTFFEELWADIKKAFDSVLSWIKTAITDPIKTIKEVLGGAWDAIFGGGEVSATVKQVKDISETAQVESIQSPAQESRSTTQAALVGGGNVEFNIPITVTTSGNINEKKLAQQIAERVRIEVEGIMNRREA